MDLISLVAQACCVDFKEAETWIEFFFDKELFMNRDGCGNWDPRVKAQYILANALTNVAYFVLPVIILRYQAFMVLISTDTAFRVLFGGFILTCGIGHMEHVISFWWTQYHLFAQWHTLTAVVSWLTIFRGFGMGRKLSKQEKVDGWEVEHLAKFAVTSDVE